ncbi:MAG: response regulator [Planctomycetes bacterium]|nr:response regulator [Planctomycetota bacterium]
MVDASPGAAAAERPRVLVIDDEPLFRSLISGLLKNDFEVETAADGAEGYFRALKSRPHVAIIDIQMPGWDGLTTLHAFHTHPALRDVRTIVLSSDATRPTVVAAIRAGANEYLIKTGFSREELLRKLRNLLRTQAASQQPPSQLSEADGSVASPHDNAADAASIPPVQHVLDEWD